MLVQFKVVADDSAWLIDTVLMNYLHAENLEEGAKILERGKMVFVGLQGPLRIFALEGRRIDTKGPGAGFCTFGYALVDLDTTVTFFIQCNVPIKDLHSVRPIEAVRYELIPTGQEKADDAATTEAQTDQDAAIKTVVDAEIAEESREGFIPIDTGK